MIVQLILAQNKNKTKICNRISYKPNADKLISDNLSLQKFKEEKKVCAATPQTQVRTLHLHGFLKDAEKNVENRTKYKYVIVTK